MEVALHELGEIFTGNTPSKKNKDYWNSEDTVFIKPNDLNNNNLLLNDKNSEYISKEAISKARIVGRNSILVTCIGTIGKVAITTNAKTAFNQQINAIIPNKNVYPKYLAYALMYYQPRLAALANAPVVPIINKKQFSNFKVNLNLDKEIQYTIIRQLDLINEIIENKNRQLNKLNELIKARFVEMFGNYKFDTPISIYIHSLSAGKSLAGNERCKNKVLNTGAVSYDYFINDYKYLPIDYVPDESNKVKSGNVLISRMNTQELVGATAYVWNIEENTYLPDRLWRANIKENINPIFIWQLLIQPPIKIQIRRVSSGTSGSMKNISKINFLSLKVPNVSIELQNEFANFVQQVDKSKVAVQKSLDETQKLFDSLMQEYFG